MRDIVRGYNGEDLMTLSTIKTVPIVEGFLHENDYVIIAAPPKIGKSILVQQLTCNLSSGTPFLNKFAIPNPVTVWYFATEGKDEDTKSRLIRMSHEGAVPIDPENIFLFCSAGFRFNTKLGVDLLRGIERRIGRTNPPKVIIIDALYRAVKGSIKDDEVVNEFHQEVGALADRYDAAVVVVHHMRKPIYFDSGEKQQRTDDDTYGSAFLKASVDQLYWMDKCDKNPKDIMLKCDTQRSGDMIEDLRLTLIEPDPLYFKVTSLYTDEIHRVVTVLNSHKGGMTVDALIKLTGLKRAIFYLCAKELIDLGRITKTETRPVIYKINNGHTI